MKKRIRLSKSFRKYIREKKAEIRRTILDPQEAEKRIQELEELKKNLLELKIKFQQEKENKKEEKEKTESLK